MNKTIKLPSPEIEWDFPLMKALSLRRTKRRWKPDNLSDRDLSNLLWAACGITSAETTRSKCKRTAPSARNAQSIKIYVALNRGVFRYEEKNHELICVSEQDIREHIGSQKMMKSAPAGLIYVADYSKLKGYTGTDDDRKQFVAGTETGFISQNVYLYCAASNMSTAVIGLVNRENLQKVMNLAETEKVIYTQAVGLSI